MARDFVNARRPLLEAMWKGIVRCGPQGNRLRVDDRPGSLRANFSVPLANDPRSGQVDADDFFQSLSLVP